MALPTLSASKLKTFVGCNKRYQYQYIERFPQDKHPAAALGTAVHATIDKVYKQRQDPVSLFIKEFTKELYDANLNLDPFVLARYTADGIAMVGDYNYLDNNPTATEVEFRLKFPNDSQAICTIHGFIDQIYDWGFVDLKTNKQKPKQEDLNSDLQFILYQWAYKQITGNPAMFSVWHHLRTQERLNAYVLNKEAFAEKTIEDILTAKQSGEYPKNRAYHCRWCPFKEPCFAEDEV